MRSWHGLAFRLAGIGVLLPLLLLCAGTSGYASEATLLTGGPLFDYRSAPSAHYRSLHILGPLFKFEQKGDEVEYALRPFFYRAADAKGLAQTEVLYPLAVERSQPQADYLDILHLLNADSGSRESGSSNQFYLFPLLFYGDDPEYGRYAAFFPVGGTLHNWFGRDHISFALFPLYGATERGTTRTTHLLWPFFSLVSGENESGFGLWPLYGESAKSGVYHRRYAFWPVFFDEEWQLDTTDPHHRFAVLPFWYEESSLDHTQTSVLWPFFSRIQDGREGYDQWDAPWPLVRVTSGSSRHGLRLLPLYADETIGDRRKRWFGWPLYQIEDLDTDLILRQRHRLLYFLYSDLAERKLDTGAEKRRVDLWPLFSYHRENGVSRLNAIAILDAFFPENKAVERSWSPLWRVYQQRWDERGNLVVSILWNLYWQERQGEALAWELFPLADYRAAGDTSRWRILKGLFGWHRAGNERCLELFYFDRAACRGTPAEPAGEGGP